MQRDTKTLTMLDGDSRHTEVPGWLWRLHRDWAAETNSVSNTERHQRLMSMAQAPCPDFVFRVHEPHGNMAQALWTLLTLFPGDS